MKIVAKQRMCHQDIKEREGKEREFHVARGQSNCLWSFGVIESNESDVGCESEDGCESEGE